MMRYRIDIAPVTDAIGDFYYKTIVCEVTNEGGFVIDIFHLNTLVETLAVLQACSDRGEYEADCN